MPRNRRPNYSNPNTPYPKRLPGNERARLEVLEQLVRRQQQEEEIPVGTAQAEALPFGASRLTTEQMGLREQEAKGMESLFVGPPTDEQALNDYSYGYNKYPGDQEESAALAGRIRGKQFMQDTLIDEDDAGAVHDFDGRWVYIPKYGKHEGRLVDVPAGSQNILQTMRNQTGSDPAAWMGTPYKLPNY
jgi:hypothetical protein